MMNTDYESRDAAICKLYADGESMTNIGKRYKVSKARVQQILRREGVWKPYKRSEHNQIVGVRVSPHTKKRLRDKANKRGVSIQKLANEILEDAAIDDEGPTSKLKTATSC